jgi:hypothetical protein
VETATGALLAPSARNFAAATLCSANLSAAARWERSLSAKASGACGAAVDVGTCCGGLAAGAAADFIGRRGAMGAGFDTVWATRTGVTSGSRVSGALLNSPEMRGMSLLLMPKRSRQLRFSELFVEF